MTGAGRGAQARMDLCRGHTSYKEGVAPDDATSCASRVNSPKYSRAAERAARSANDLRLATHRRCRLRHGLFFGGVRSDRRPLEEGAGGPHGDPDAAEAREPDAIRRDALGPGVGRDAEAREGADDFALEAIFVDCLVVLGFPAETREEARHGDRWWSRLRTLELLPG